MEPTTDTTGRSVKCYTLTEAKGMEQIIEYIRLHPLSGIHEKGTLDYIDKMVAQLKIKGEQSECKTHPDAPHGFSRNASHSEGRYVCECEHWEEKNT